LLEPVGDGRPRGMIAEPRKGGTEPGLSAGFPFFALLDLIQGVCAACGCLSSTQSWPMTYTSIYRCFAILELLFEFMAACLYFGLTRYCNLSLENGGRISIMSLTRFQMTLW
jgi:hypothetical protein